MARGIVVVGTPADLEPREFENKKGETQRSLAFRLIHPATAMGGTVQIEVRDEGVWKAVETAHAAVEQIALVAVPFAVRYEKDGENRDFVKLSGRAVVPL